MLHTVRKWHSSSWRWSCCPFSVPASCWSMFLRQRSEGESRKALADIGGQAAWQGEPVKTLAVVDSTCIPLASSKQWSSCCTLCKTQGKLAWEQARQEWSAGKRASCLCPNHTETHEPLHSGVGTQSTEPDFQTTAKCAEASTVPDPRSALCLRQLGWDSKTQTHRKLEY